jgi:hypothetical protein
MGILNKKREVKNHMSVRAEQSQHSMRQVSRPERAGCSKIRNESNDGNQQPFGDDFNLEHSSFVSTTMVAYAGSSCAMEPATARSTFAQDFRSPSCVYVG